MLGNIQSSPALYPLSFTPHHLIQHLTLAILLLYLLLTIVLTVNRFG